MTRRSSVLFLFTVVLVAAFALHASGKPVPTMANGPKGKVEFDTLTLGATDFWNGVKTGPVTTISGELLFPKGDERVPLIVLTHGGGGISGMEEGWARELRSLGVGVFLVDSFSARKIKLFPPESQLSRAGQVYDVYQALRLLATHPRVDPDRIALMGGSRGGGLTVLAAMTRSLKAQGPENVEFAAYLPIYPTIIRGTDYGALASRPIRVFTGTADEANPIGVIREFVETQRASGADIKLYEYEGAHHSFDNIEIRAPFLVRGPTNFTVAYHPQAHAQMKKDVRAVVREIFGKR